MQGWIKLHRKIRHNAIFNNHQLYRLWMICLLEAAHKQHKQIVGNQTLLLEPGQFVTGRFDLHSGYNNGLKKKDQASEYTVWRWLLSLEKCELVSIKTSNKFSIVSIVNWAMYQDYEEESERQNEQEMSNKRATNEQQMSTNKNVKNVKNVKNEKNDLKSKKIKYAEFVSMTEEEHQKLVDQYGKEKTERFITVLDNYKGSKGKRYKNDYRTILNWVVEEEERRASRPSGSTRHYRRGQASDSANDAGNQTLRHAQATPNADRGDAKPARTKLSDDEIFVRR